jgi:hypothetical protein
LLGQCVKHGITHSVRLHLDVRNDERAQDLFLICGTGGNSVAKKLFTKSPSIAFRLSLSSHGREIVDDEDKPVHSPADGRERNYGIIAKLRNPWARPNRSTCVYLAAGINGLGTWRATDYLAIYAPELLKPLYFCVYGDLRC